MKQIVNDFSITVGTVNGSGSSTANTTILRAIFKMGIPVSGNDQDFRRHHQRDEHEAKPEPFARKAEIDEGQPRQQ